MTSTSENHLAAPEPPLVLVTPPTTTFDTNAASKVKETTNGNAKANGTQQTPFSRDLIQLEPPLHPSRLPHHESLDSLQTDLKHLPNLEEFVGAALQSARDFTSDSKLARGEQVISGGEGGKSYNSSGYRYHGSDGKVKSLSWKGTKDGATWAARFSRHDGKDQAGDASWEEFDNTIRKNHTLREKDYTPTVVDAHEVCQWKNIAEVPGWKNVEMRLYETMHKMPVPLLKSRVFTILVITGEPTNPAKSDARSFYVLTVPVILAKSKYSDAKDVVHGAYVAVEYVHEVEVDGKTEIEWVMATASDARGVLPKWMQASAVKGEIAKDVGLVLDWVHKGRVKK
jgi:hypothetical protein